MRRISTWLWTAVLLCAGCASMQAARARQQRLETELNAQRYTQPRDQVWQKVRQLLADQGCPLAGADAEAVGQSSTGVQQFLSPARETHPYQAEGGLLQELGMMGGRPAKPTEGSISLDTGWRRKGDRFHVDGLVDGSGFRVLITRVERDLTNYQERRTRDLDLELQLADRVDPSAAERIRRVVAAEPR